MSQRFDCSVAATRRRGIDRAEAAVAAGDLLVLPTDTVYGIGCDAFTPEAVEALLAAKGRGRSLPPPVLVAHARTLDGLATDIPAAVRDLAEAFWPGPLTVVCHAQPSLDWDLGDTRGTVAIRIPLHPVALEVLDRTGPLAVSSANRTGRPAATSCDEAMEQLGDAVRLYLDAGPTAGNVPSTIVDGTSEAIRVLRAGALSLEQLREVVPGLLDLDETDPDGVENADATP